MESHLLQMRGLKLNGINNLQTLVFVASFTDAWIETLMYANWQSDAYVASFTDAWIETGHTHTKDVDSQVASFTDAWIETPGGIAKKLLRSSHLLQMRGLKQQVGGFINSFARVASFTDAWIETACALVN